VQLLPSSQSHPLVTPEMLTMKSGFDLQGRPLHLTHLFVSDIVLPKGLGWATRVGRPDVAEPFGIAAALHISVAL